MRKKKVLILFICLLFIMTGCNNNELGNKDNFDNQETFMLGHTFDDDRVIHLSFNVPYKDDYLMNEFSNEELTIDEFINKLDFVSDINDGGSKLYKYNNNIEKIFGNEEFYVMVCNSTDGIKDIYVTKKKDGLANYCLLKYNDLEGVSMKIKEGTLTNEGATVIITDTSERENIYGQEYRIDKLVDGKWTQQKLFLKVITHGQHKDIIQIKIIN